MSDDKSQDDKSSGGAMEKVFEAFGGEKDGKISKENAKKWLKKAGITGESGISEEEAEKEMPDSAKKEGGGMDMEEFKEYAQKLGKNSKMKGQDIMGKLSSAMPSKEDVEKKMDDIKSKITDK